MITKEKEEMIAATVLWWLEKLGGPPQGLEGDRESFGSLLAVLLSATSGQGDLTQESQKRFAEELKSYLEEKSLNGGSVILGTDYGPEWPLSDICRKANVSGARFPNKTTMWIDFEKETVSWRIVRGPEGQIYPPL